MSWSRTTLLADLGEETQGTIPGLVAVLVVELLEFVEVGEGEREKLVAAFEQAAKKLAKRRAPVGRAR